MATDNKPDPTVITTEIILREIGHLKELMVEKFNTRDEKFQTQTVRVDSIESRLDHKYVETADAIKNLRELTEEKFKGLSTLTEQSREDAKTRLEAAFKSANDARDKSEASFTKQIDNLSDKVETMNKATNEKIDRERSRADTGEGVTRASNVDRTDRAVGRGQSISIVAAAIAFSGILVTLAIFLINVRSS